MKIIIKKTIEEFVTPSANVFIRQHWAKRRKQKSDWGFLIRRAFGRTRDEVKKKRKVIVTRVSNRLLDRANLWLSIDKLIIDNLVSQEWLVDDSEKWIDLHVKQKTGEKKMIIEILEGK